ncbi:MAG: hypothetical protein HY425_02280 [Candidatus Levybacteria bacterium]|nr:hypothetical protein [Candidatus Levybacteria bacterium]
MTQAIESGMFSLSKEVGQVSPLIGWLGQMEQYERDTHAKFENLYEKLANEERFPRGFDKRIRKHDDNPWIWTYLSFAPSKKELDEVPKPLRMFFNDLGIKPSDKVDVEIYFRTKKSEDGKPGKYDGDFSFEVRPQGITENKIGASISTDEFEGFSVSSTTRPEYYYFPGPYSGLPMSGTRDVPTGRGKDVGDFYRTRNPGKKLISRPIHTAILKGAADWIEDLLVSDQKGKPEDSSIDFGWIDIFSTNGSGELAKARQTASRLFDLTGEVAEYKWGTNPAEKRRHGELSIDVKPEDYDMLPEVVENLLIDLGIRRSTPLEMIIEGENTLQLLPKSISRTTMGIVFEMSYSVNHKVVAPQAMRSSDRGFEGEYFERGKEVDKGYAQMPVILRQRILNETLKWGEDILIRRKTSR